MLLKKQEKNDVIKAMYSSSNVIASIYDKDSGDLTLIFNKGSQYKYPKVKLTDYTRFELAESQGKVFNSHIKTYSFEKLDNINVDTIIKEIDILKEAEEKALLEAKQLKLVTIMKNLLTNTDVIYTETQLNGLQEALSELLTQSIKPVAVND